MSTRFYSDMNTEEKIGIMKHFSLFQTLTDQEITYLAQHAKPLVFLPHQTIVSQDNAGEGIYATYKGLLRSFILSEEGKIIPIKIKCAPYINGIVDVIDNKRASRVEAIQETYSLFIPKECFIKVIMKNVHLSFSLLQLVTRKLRETNMQTEYYFSAPLKNKTLRTLQELAPFFPDHIITLSQEEVADIVGATRARVTEVLNELSSQKIISISQRKILVLQRTA